MALALSNHVVLRSDSAAGAPAQSAPAAATQERVTVATNHAACDNALSAAAIRPGWSWKSCHMRGQMEKVTSPLDEDKLAAKRWA